MNSKSTKRRRSSPTLIVVALFVLGGCIEPVGFSDQPVEPDTGGSDTGHDVSLEDSGTLSDTRTDDPTDFGAGDSSDAVDRGTVCETDCTPGEYSCQNSNNVSWICVAGDVCNRWEEQATCGDRERCKPDTGKCACFTPYCAPNSTVCDGNVIKNCKQDADGCSYLEGSTPCPDQHYCDDEGDQTTCIPCVDPCNTGEMRCKDATTSTIERCIDSADGCGKWVQDSCSGGSGCSLSFRCGSNPDPANCGTCGDCTYCTLNGESD